MHRPWLVGVLLAAGLARAQQGDEPKIVVVNQAPALVEALGVTGKKRNADVVWLRLDRAGLDDKGVEVLRRWVADGGTLWTETDLAQVFGFRCVRPNLLERVGHARRACPLEASPLVSACEDVYYRCDANAVFVLAGEPALPLLRVADGSVPAVVVRRGLTGPPTAMTRLVAAELQYGAGRVIHRPTEFHPARGESQRFSELLTALSRPSADDVLLPVDGLVAAQGRCAELVGLAPEGERAKSLLLSLFLAYRLWWADYLTATGQYDQALGQLRAISADLPDDPAVLLAVARWNDRQGRAAAAEEARRKARDGFLKAKRELPGPEARQVRVPWASFAEALNAAGKAWEKPSREGVAVLGARTAYLLGLDRYRRDEPTGETLLREAATRTRGWSPPAFALGLLYMNRGEDLRQSNRDRLAYYTAAEQWCEQALKNPVTGEWDKGAADFAKAWRDAAKARAAQVKSEPQDAQVTPHFIFRYDASDARFGVPALWTKFQSAFNGAYATVAQWGVSLDPTEVLIWRDGFALKAALPEVGVTRQAFGASAVVGRRIHTIPDPPQPERTCRHEFAHVVCNALTQGGFPPPLWFEEGLAAGMEQYTLRAMAAAEALQAGRALSLPQLNDPETLFRRDLMDHGFGQCELMVTALTRRFGQGVLVPFLLNLGWGVTAETAFKTMTQMTQQQYLQAFLAGRL